MNIIAIAGAAVVAAVAALMLRRQNPQTALMISIGAGAVILLSVIRNLILTADEVEAILIAGGVSTANIMILLRAIGIALLTEFCCDTVSEAGMLSLSTNLSFAGKLLILATALPLMQDVLKMVVSLVNVS